MERGDVLAFAGIAGQVEELLGVPGLVRGADQLPVPVLREPLLGADKLALLDQPYAMMQAFCEAENLTCLDLMPIFTPYAEAGEQLYYTTDMHLNARGNALLAETPLAAESRDEARQSGRSLEETLEIFLRALTAR